MTGKVHTILGVSTMVAIAIMKPDLTIIDVTVSSYVALLGAATGSLLPDIDIAQSRMGQKVKWLSKHLTHRGITHTLLVPFLLCVIFYFLRNIPILNSVLVGIFVGYIAHIFADMFNSKGVPILWPLSSSKIHFASVKTASTTQQTIFIVIWEVILCLVMVSYFDYWPTIMEFFTSMM